MDIAARDFAEDQRVVVLPSLFTANRRIGVVRRIDWPFRRFIISHGRIQHKIEA